MAQQQTAQAQLKYQSQTWFLAEKHEAEEAEDGIDMEPLEHFITQTPDGQADFHSRVYSFHFSSPLPAPK